MTKRPNCTQQKAPISRLRKEYIVRFIGRILVLIACVLLYVFLPDTFRVLEGGNFYRMLSPLHILWVIWVIDMLHQLIPVKKHIPLGSQKLFKQRFKPIRDKINYQALKEYVTSTTKSAYKVFLLWAVLTLTLGALHLLHVLSAAHLFLICVLFYVGDLVCVLIWCPFRLIVKSRCCTTCRIFNWDHLMMFTPMLFVNSFYSISLLVMAFAIWVIWELCIMLYPERFWEHSNEALRCSQCTEKLCSQYCKKLR